MGTDRSASSSHLSSSSSEALRSSMPEAAPVLAISLTSAECDRVIELATDWNVSVSEAVGRLVRIGFRCVNEANEQRTTPA